MGRPARIALGIARALLVVLPLAWLGQRVDLAGIGHGVARVGWSRLGLGLLAQLALSLLVSVRWRLLLASYGGHPRPSLRYLWRANLVANYFALLPVPGADEGVRVARTLHAFPPGQPAAYLVIATERITGLVGLLLLALLSSFAAHRVLDQTVLRALTIGSAIAFALALPALVLPDLLRRGLVPREQVARIPFVGATLARLEPPARRRSLVLAVLLSVAGHFGSCAVIALLFGPLDPTATLWVCVRMQPIVLLAMAFPVTPAGLGQRELVFAALYALAGVSSTHAVTVALLSFALALAQSAIGGVLYAAELLVRARQARFVDG